MIQEGSVWEGQRKSVYTHEGRREVRSHSQPSSLISKVCCDSGFGAGRLGFEFHFYLLLIAVNHPTSTE